MPIYEFRCDQCGQKFEALQTIEEHEQRKPECPRCHSAARVETELQSFMPVTSRKA